MDRRRSKSSLRLGRRSRFLSALLTATALIGTPNAVAASIAPSTFADDDTINGNCTLREAVRSANLNGGVDNCQPGTGADTITLAAGTYGLSLGPTGEQAAAGGDLDITDPAGLTIAGDRGGSTVDARGLDRAFEVIAGANAGFDRLTITGGASGVLGGGGIEMSGAGATATVTRSTVTGNNGAIGGGLDVNGTSTLTVIESTVAGNVAAANGGGINAQTGALLNVVNSTISGNRAGSNGGAVHAEGLNRPTVNVLSTTITANSAANGGGTLAEAGNTVNLKGSILAGNAAMTSGPDCGGALNSQGNNLIGDVAGCPVAAQASDVIGKPAALGPLAGNGGPTLTHALLAGSPAVDKGPGAAPATDQRGVPRKAPDIGAYERATCHGVAITLIGSNGADTLTGTPGADGFLLLGGNDAAFGLGGNDGLCGGGGNDRLFGGSGRDRASGDAGRDLLKGGSGKDSLSGGGGRDRLFGGAGKDKLKGLAGNDKLSGQGGRDVCNGGAGHRDKAAGCEGRKKLP
jgi:CSLREA domain-containing protein